MLACSGVDLSQHESLDEPRVLIDMKRRRYLLDFGGVPLEQSLAVGATRIISQQIDVRLERLNPRWHKSRRDRASHTVMEIGSKPLAILSADKPRRLSAIGIINEAGVEEAAIAATKDARDLEMRIDWCRQLREPLRIFASSPSAFTTMFKQLTAGAPSLNGNI